MAKVKYDVGDILTWSNDDDCYMTAVIVRWHTKSIFVEGISLEQHTDYDAFIKAKGDDFRFIREAPEIVLCKYKVVGHVDISGMPNDEVKAHLDRVTATEWNEHRIAYAVQAHWALMKLYESKEENKYVKKEFYIPKMTDEYCCWDGYDKLEKENRRLKEECKQKQKHLDLANNKIFELKKEVDSLRQALRDDSIRIYKNLGKMGFTEDAVFKIMHSELNDI